MKKELLIKTLAIGIIILFIGVSFQPIIAEETVSFEKESDYINVDFEEAKEYLFQTIIKISNNPEFKEFLNEHKHDLFTNDYDVKNAVQKILLQKPRLLKSILFTRPKMTYEYLETNNKIGFEIFNILGEEESSNLVESYKIANTELFNELKDIILNDEELSNRISVLEEMNQELKSDSTYWDFPIICNILNNWYNNVSLIVKIGDFFYRLTEWAYYNHHPLLHYIFSVFWDLFVNLSMPIIFLILAFGCVNPYP